MSGEDFASHRLAATREFAQTMIIVDDEAWKPPLGVKPHSGLRLPRRGRATPAADSGQSEMFEPKRALDTENLVDAALSLGLICSVVRPPKGKSIKAQVGLAAKRADIVCLDWELHGDGGDAATRIIAEIVRADDERNGRLRLIAIYTGDITNNKILEKVFDVFPKSYRERVGLTRDPICIQSNGGLRIVCLFKAHGVQLADARKERQVAEKDLPARLQQEFALLAGGLLSNVALATIASIRDSTHHLLAKMAAPMDAPYFHHRSILPMVEDAEEYSVDVILSDLKSEVDKRGVAKKYAGTAAVSARIREMAGLATTLRLHYLAGGVAREFDVTLNDAIKLITDGYKVGHGVIGANPKPTANNFKGAISSMFAKDLPAANAGMRQFAVLTGVRSHPGSYLYKSGRRFPQLGLGSILKCDKGRFFLCLQASCDSVRIKKKRSFLFVPLNKTDSNPDHMVPVLGRGGKVEYIGLECSNTAYAETVSLTFEPDTASETVIARKVKKRRGLFFVSASGDLYRWIADLKQRRALRTAQKLGQSMGRLGFDEFEPFRRD